MFDFIINYFNKNKNENPNKNQNKNKNFCIIYNEQYRNSYNKLCQIVWVIKKRVN